MTNLSDTELFNQLHIDVARNATDDFNLFHDSKKWQYIKNNPFNGTIVLGFQLESLWLYFLCFIGKSPNRTT